MKKAYFNSKIRYLTGFQGFSDSKVFVGGDAINPETRDATREITVHDLLTHTSGLTYHFHMANAVDEMYRRAGFDWTSSPGDLENQCNVLASLRCCLTQAQSGIIRIPPMC